MSRPKLLLHAVTRSMGEEQEELTFEPGVNLIVGPRNSGKSKWLQTIDQLLGDDIEANERSTDDILLKYDSAGLSFSIGEEGFAVERRWKQAGLYSKVSVNGDMLSLKEYRDLLMERLEIPIVHYPQGDPYGQRAWPELGWRSLFRHIYRRQRFWNDLADQQPRASSTPASCSSSASPRHSSRRTTTPSLSKRSRLRGCRRNGTSSLGCSTK